MKKFMVLLGAIISALLLMPNVYAAGEKAAIGNVKYATLEEAYADAVAEDTIVLLDDVVLTNTLVVTKNLTLDLNGHTLARSSEVINVDGAKLVVTGTGTIKELVPDTAGIRVIGSDDESKTEYSSLKVDKDVTIEAWAPVFVAPKKVGSSYAQVAYGIKVEVAGTLVSKLDSSNGTGSGIYINGNIKNLNNYPVITVLDGASIDANDTGIYQAGYSKVVVGKANIVATGTGIGTKAGKVELNGTSISVTGPASDPSSYNNGINTVGAAIQIESSKGYAGKVEVEINGGTYKSANNAVIVEYLADASGSTPAATETEVKEIKITDGNFVAKEGEDVIVASNNFKATKTEFISGGTFSSDVEEYLAEDIEMVEDENGNLVAGVIYNVTTKKVANGKLAFDKLSGLAGTKVKVTATANEGYELKAVKVVDAEGKEVKVTDGVFAMPNSDVVVSAEFVEVVVEKPVENPETSDIDHIALVSIISLGVAGLGYTLKKRRFN